MLCYIPNKTNSLTRNIFLLSGGGVIILSYCLSLILIQGFILTFIHNFYFWTFKLFIIFVLLFCFTEQNMSDWILFDIFTDHIVCYCVPHCTTVFSR